METITSRAFQLRYQRLVEPVVVKANFRTLGTWYPKGTEPEDNSVPLSEALKYADEISQLSTQAHQLLAQRDEAIAEVHQLRRKVESLVPTPVAKPASNVRASTKPPAATEIHVGTATYSSRPFTPAPKGK